MSLASHLRRTSFLCLLGGFATVTVQGQHPDPALEQILTRVEANTDRYKASVPSFFCDEHIVSQELHDGSVKHETTIEALFRVTRSSSPLQTLEESREVSTINGRPSGGKKLDMPISFSGGFSRALTKFLSAEHRQCFNYDPDPSSLPPGTEAFTFTANEGASGQPGCSSIQAGTTGKFVIDSSTWQVTHIERTVPHPIGKDSAVRGTASVDFAPVTLNGKTFWLPLTVTAFTTETSRTNAFRFTATYANYHRFAATSSIVPNAADPTPP
ncbi:hypothetical protein [Granulicella sp. S190]|uniref:hypothetical protein n=1 Tax=Granulicella sp. S190 TaxID=1747226 RepID=UPI00131E07A5|nr:hypothetical protein [Granulicella sp. S190]